MKRRSFLGILSTVPFVDALRGFPPEPPPAPEPPPPAPRYVTRAAVAPGYAETWATCSTFVTVAGAPTTGNPGT